MTVFATALATLHKDPNLSTPATLTRAVGGNVSCRVILSQPQEEFAGQRSKAIEAGITSADLAGVVPAVGDSLVISSTTYRVSDVQQDVLALSWTLTLVTTS